jgi:hypothetical protein
MAASCRNGLPRVLEPRGVVDHQPRRLELGGHLRELELHALELGDALAELLALLHVRTVASSAPCATPIICAPMPMRPSFSVSMAIL